mgnify:CR=1 FL=1
MIEKMKVVHIVAAQTQKTELLDALRALGIVHFAEKADADQTYLERFAALSRLITVLEEQGGSEVEAETLDDDQFKVLFDKLNACLERKKALEAERAAALVYAAAPLKAAGDGLVDCPAVHIVLKRTVSAAQRKRSEEPRPARGYRVQKRARSVRYAQLPKLRFRAAAAAEHSLRTGA